MNLALIYAALFYFICHYTPQPPKDKYLPRPAPVTHANHR